MFTPLIKNLKSQIFRLGCILLCGLMATGCDGFFDKDNTPKPTPLAHFTPEITPQLLWSASIGKGPGKEYLKMHPVMSVNALYAASTQGTITAIDKATGRINWRSYTSLALAAGPGVGDGIVVVASKKGNVVALAANSGKVLWHAKLEDEVLSPPAVGAGRVIVKCTDGSVYGLSVTDGHQIWSTDQPEPSLILHAASAPLLQSQYTIIGFANGHLLNLTTADGRIHWQQSIATAQGAFSVDRMIDIDADPLIYNNSIYVATYQGKLVSLDWRTGAVLWSHDLSSYTGMAAADQTITISDAQSRVWAFNTKNGNPLWQQSKLYARAITGPAVLGRYVIVGDAEGFLHWLDKRDGHVVGRTSVGKPIYTNPLSDGKNIYVLTSKGKLLAYTDHLNSGSI